MMYGPLYDDWGPYRKKVSYFEAEKLGKLVCLFDRAS